MALSASQVQQFYIGYYGRPADPVGLAYWQTQDEAAALAGFVGSAEFTSQFTGLSVTQQVTKVYVNLLGRAPDPEGLMYWALELAAGRESLGSLVLSMARNALGKDVTTIANRIEYASAFTAALDTAEEINAYAGPAATQIARDALLKVVAHSVGDRSALDAELARIDDTIALIVGGGDEGGGDGGDGGDGGGDGGGGDPGGPVDPSKTYVLTVGVDDVPGTAGNDTIVAADDKGSPTFTAGDQIDGGGGTDVMNWTQASAIGGVPAGALVRNVEILNVVSGGAIDLDTTGNFTGLTTLAARTTAADQRLSAAATTDVVATADAQGASALSVQGGRNISVNATGVTTGTITVGAAAGATAEGTVTVNSASATLVDGVGETTQKQGAIAVTGGTRVTVNVSGSVSGPSDHFGDALWLAPVTVTGGASTTEVTVSQTAAQARLYGPDGRAAIVNGKVTITDANASSTTAAGTLATVTLDSYGNASSIVSSALGTLNLSGTGGTLDVAAGALAKDAVDTLDLRASGLTASSISLGDNYQALHLHATGAGPSTIGNITGANVATLGLSGDAKLVLASQGFGAAKDIVSTNTAGVTLGTPLADDVRFTGGAGNDTISIGATTHAIDMGDGDDVVVMSSPTLGAGGTLHGGAGRNTIEMNTDGSSVRADPTITGFDVLRVAGAQAKGVHDASGFQAVEIGQVIGGATTLQNIGAGVGVTLRGALHIAGLDLVLADASGVADVMQITVATAVTMSMGPLRVPGVETVHIHSIDTSAAAVNGEPRVNNNSVQLQAEDATSIVLTGNIGAVLLYGDTNEKVTYFDASGIQGAAADARALGVYFESANKTPGAMVTIHGGSGHDTLIGGALTDDTIHGGAGDDTLLYLGGKDEYHGGEGNDTFEIHALGMKAAFLTIADAAPGDRIVFANRISTGLVANQPLGAKVSLGDGATFEQYLDAAAAGDGSTNALARWFQHGGDTYLVLDNTADATFANTDTMVKLVGTIDLSTSAFTTGDYQSDVLTLA